MKKTFLAGAGVALLLAATAAPAQAGWYTPNGNYGTLPGSMLRVDQTARVSADGFSVTWPAQIRCPKGESFALWQRIDERDSPLLPELYGEDYGIMSQVTSFGTCTGGAQNIRATLQVQPTTVESDPPIFVPIRPTEQTNSVALLTIPGTGYVGWCAAPSCAGTTGPYVTIR